MYPDLNLPSAALQLINDQDQIYVHDIIRKKNILLTPEEWVRQHFLHFLMTHRAFPKALMKMESALQYNRLNKRTDIQVYDRDGAVFMLVECKAAHIPVNDKTLHQASLYNKTIQAKWLIITNGLQHYAFERMEGEEKLQYEKRKDIPFFTHSLP